MEIFFTLNLLLFSSLVSSEVNQGNDRLIRNDWATLSDQTTIRFFNPANYVPGLDIDVIWNQLGQNISCHVDQDNVAHVEPPQGFDSNKVIKAFAHGFSDTTKNCDLASVDGSCLTDYVNAWMEASNQGYNVILVDWSNLAFALQVDGWDDYLYDLAAKNSIDVGEFLGKCLAGLSNGYNVPAENIHLVGHSLGAHLMGKAARTFGEGQINGDLVGRLTGVDPAGPRFFDGPILSAIPELAANIITPESAQFVDIVHTNGGLEPMATNPLEPRCGALHQLGHMDFYMDGGSVQTGCVFGQDALPFGACSHMRSVIYYLHSIREPSLFPALGCSSVEDCNNEMVEDPAVIGYMGEQADQFYQGGRQLLYHDIQFCHWNYYEYSNWLCV